MTVMKKLAGPGAAGFFEKLLASDNTPAGRALKALADSLRSIATDPELTEQKREELAGVSCDEFQDHVNKNIGAVSETFVATAEAIAKSLSNREIAERRAAQARANLKHPYDPPAKDKPKDDEPKKEKNMTQFVRTKEDAHQQMLKLAERERDVKKGETVAQAYARLIETRHPAMVVYKSAHDNMKHADPAAVPKLEKSEPQDLGYLRLLAKAQELRQAEPRLTKEQAFAKVYERRENADLVAMHKMAVA